MLYAVQLLHTSPELPLFICARYPSTGPPSASRPGGLQVTFTKLHPPVKTECKMGGYGTSVRSNRNASHITRQDSRQPKITESKTSENTGQI